MKKILAFAVAAVAAVAMASADPLIVGHGYFGVGLGSTVTNADGSKLAGANDWEFASNLDLGVGVGLNIPFGGYFGVQPGVDFCVNNVGYTNTVTTDLIVHTTTKTTHTYSYLSLDIPVLLTAKVNKFNFALGPYVSFVLGEKLTEPRKTVVTGGSGSGTTETKYEHLHSWGSVGLAVGMGYEQRLGMGMLVIGGRYMLDFIPIEIQHTNSSGDRVTDYKFNRRELAIDVGYKIPLSF